jgi:hypothetical protein
VVELPAGVRVDSPGDGVVVVEFADEHDVTTKEVVRALLAGLIDENDLVVADVTDARFIDSSFIHNVLVADETAKEKGKAFRLQRNGSDRAACTGDQRHPRCHLDRRKPRGSHSGRARRAGERSAATR